MESRETDGSKQKNLTPCGKRARKGWKNDVGTYHLGRCCRNVRRVYGCYLDSGNAAAEILARQKEMGQGVKMQFYNRCLYPLIRQLANGKISRALFEFEWRRRQIEREKQK
jgi:hypothetical protein